MRGGVALHDCLVGQGKLEEAEQMSQRALLILEQHLGQHHPETGQMLRDLALLRQKQSNLSEAISFAERALHIRLQSLGEAHPKTIATQTLYTQLLQEQAGAQQISPSADAAETLDPLQTKRSSHAFSPSEHDPLQAFLDSRCELHPLAQCRISELWQAYEQWTATIRRRVPLARRAFAAQVKARGCRVDRTSTARIWRGIRLVDKTQ